MSSLRTARIARGVVEFARFRVLSGWPPQLVAVIAGFLVVRHTGNVMHAFAVGMPTMGTLQLVL